MSPVKKRKKLREIIREKKARPCVDCGEQFGPEEMSFDHIGIKIFNLGGSLSGRTEAQVMAELKKVEVVCLDCHRIREWLRGRCGLPEGLKVISAAQG